MRTTLLYMLFVLLARIVAADPPVFEMRAVAAKPDATKTWYSLNIRDHAPEALFLDPKVLLDQTAVKSASVQHDNDGVVQIQLNFTEDGARRFAEVTERLRGKRIGMLVQGRLVSAPVIRDRISGGSAIISGNMTETEANDLAAKLNQVPSK